MSLEIRNNGKPIKDMQSEWRAFMSRAPHIVGQEAVNFFKESFEKQGFTDTGFTPWEPRKTETPQTSGKKILSGVPLLSGSIHEVSANATTVTIGTDVPYAQIHNEGGDINVPVTEKSKKYFWAMYARTKNPKYKAMAMTKKTAFNVSMPKRQFMGHSETLTNNLLTFFKNKINSIFQ